MRVISIREKNISDHRKINEVITLATIDLRSVYRRTQGMKSEVCANHSTPEALVAIIDDELVGVIEYFLELQTLKCLLS